jgi:hypothetical protein
MLNHLAIDHTPWFTFTEVRHLKITIMKIMAKTMVSEILKRTWRYRRNYGNI